MAEPAWAKALIAKVLKDRGEYDGIYLTWRRRTGECSSGCTWSDQRKVTINAGTSRQDQKLVVLHELAHILTGNAHTPKMWDCAWELYRDYGVNLTYAQKREFAYKAEARKAYKRIIGKRALRIKPFASHRHKWEEVSSAPDWPSVIRTTFVCQAPWYDTGKPCGASKMDYRHMTKQELAT